MKNHIGELSRNKQGFTLQIKKWICREKIQVAILETGELKWVSYMQFRKGNVEADIFNYPPNGDAPLKHAIVIFAGIAILILAALGGIIYNICL